MSFWESRPPSTIQLGNGGLLATFDEWGELEQVFAPNIDALQSRLASFRTQILLPCEGRDAVPAVLTLAPDAFESRVRVLPGTQILEAEYGHRASGLRLERALILHPTDPVILDSWRILGESAGLLHQSIPWMGNATSAHCSLYHPTFNALVHHRGRRWIGIVARGGVQWVQVGHLPPSERSRVWDGERAFVPMSAQHLAGFPRGPVQHGWDQVVQGPATWGALASGPGEKIEFFYICAESEKHLGELLRQVSAVETDRFRQMSESMNERRLAPAQVVLDRIRNPQVRLIAERSIDVLHALQDAHTGALMAAAEVDPHARVSGGYGYSWPRDGAYLAAALGAFYFRERVERYFEFLRNTQDPSGGWWQRYLATGHAGPSWGRIQIDEPATVIGAAYLHYRSTQDLFWLEKYWPVIERGLTFLENFHNAEHPLGLPSHDLWEERMGIHAYSLGAVASAFLCGSYLAGEIANAKAEQHYHEWGTALSQIIAEKFAPLEGPIYRSFVVSSWDYQRGGGYWDQTPDLSLIGLIKPFAIFRKRDAAAMKILDLLRGSLWNEKVGGVHRYPGDHYRGGNPWVLTTLWLGIVELSLGNRDRAKRCFDWAMAKATEHGFFPEQVHRETGQPCWVIPLGWSHAMFLLFVREVLDREAETEIW